MTQQQALQLSPDGQWLWDGSQWRPAAAAAPAPAASGAATGGKRGMDETLFAAVAALSALAFVGALVFGWAMPAFAQKPTAINLAYKAGEVRSFTLHQTSDGTTTLPDGSTQPDKSELTGTETLKVLSIDAKGVVTIDESLTVLKETLNGKPAPSTTPAHTKLLVYPDGRVERPATDPTSSASGSTDFSAVLPTGKVKPGDTWQRTYDAPFLPGTTVRYITKNKLTGYHDFSGTQVATIQSDIDSPLDVTVDAKSIPSFAQLGLPAGTKLHIVGHATAKQSSDIDLSRQRVVHATESDNIDMTMTFTGLTGPAAVALAKGIKYTSKDSSEIY